MYFFRSTAKIFSQKNVKNYVQVFNKSTSSQFVSHDLTNVRSLVKIKGPDSNKYLQNLMTNDINLLNDEKKSIYAMFCNSRGRVIHDGIIYNLKESTENEYIVEVDKSALNDFLRLLKMYKIKKKVEVTSVDDQYKLFSITNSLESNVSHIILKVLSLKSTYANNLLPIEILLIDLIIKIINLL